MYKAELIKDKDLENSVKAGKKFGYMDKVKSLEELPSDDILIGYIKQAMELNASGRSKPKIVKAKSTVEVLARQEFTGALEQDKVASSIFESKSPSFRKSYIIWLADAKTDETRKKKDCASIRMDKRRQRPVLAIEKVNDKLGVYG